MRILIVVLSLACLTCSAPAQSGSLPDPRLTPGDVLEVSQADICAHGYTKLVRDVPVAVKRQAYKEYGRAKVKDRCCEVDHLIPLELGGSNRLKNLWPEPYDIEWNAKVKDRLENRLHAMVCAGEMDLPAAQRAIATDWVAAYKLYIAQSPDVKPARHPR
jgi:hypothetical protein